MSFFKFFARFRKSLLPALAIALLAVPPAAASVDEKRTIGGRFMLRDHNSAIVTDQEFRGKFMLVYFGYTFCPDICPTSLSTIASALDILGDKADRITPIMITIDPARDSAQKLRDYVRHFHPRLVGLTGSPQMIAHVAKSYNVRYAKVEEKGAAKDDYLMDHSAGVFLMAPDGTFLVKMAHGISPETMAERINDFLKQAPPKK